MSDNSRSTGKLQSNDARNLADYLKDRRPQLNAFIERRLGAALKSKMEADDIFQEVSAEAIRSCNSIDLDQRDPFNWLCQLAERKIIDAHRRYFQAEKRDGRREVPLSGNSSDQHQAGLIELLVASITSPTAAFSRDQRQLKLLAAMEQLPDENREALRLRYSEGLSSKQIAERLGKSDGAVRVMLSRSLKKLETVLGPEAAPRGLGD